MAIVVAGIDEAGYGPLLGPLCVGCAVFRVYGNDVGDAGREGEAPDLWKLLRAAVCRKAGDSRRRIAVADSKALKLPNDHGSRHPVEHLERGVLAFCRLLGVEAASDAELLERLGARLEDRPWYAGPARGLPLAHTQGQIAVAANRIVAAMERAGVELLELRCIVVSEGALNETIRRTGSKADATILGVGEHLRSAWERYCGPCGGGRVNIVCDRLGGRTAYAGMLRHELACAEVEQIEQGARASRYVLSEAAGRRMEVGFRPEAESADLTVALASMTAKYVRELAMARFNRHWCGLAPALRPTAGYNSDARRWLREAGAVVGPEERSAMVRIA